MKGDNITVEELQSRQCEYFEALALERAKEIESMEAKIYALEQMIDGLTGS